MKREKRLTKKERKAGNPVATPHQGHIHCTACGIHLEPDSFDGAMATSTWVTCQHGSRFASCVGCHGETQARLDEHDRTGRPVETAHAWH